MRIALTRGGPGDKLCRLNTGVLLSANEPIRSSHYCERACEMNQFWSQDFHVYTLVWSPEGIVARIDGEQYCAINPGEGFYKTDFQLANTDYLKTGTKMAPFDKEFYVTLGYGVGGHNDFPDSNYVKQEKPWANGHPRAMTKFWNVMKRNKSWLTDAKAGFEIDYVRVYSL